jgi:hypothetical protein
MKFPVPACPRKPEALIQKIAYLRPPLPSGERKKVKGKESVHPHPHPLPPAGEGNFSLLQRKGRRDFAFGIYPLMDRRNSLAV